MCVCVYIYIHIPHMYVCICICINTCIYTSLPEICFLYIQTYEYIYTCIPPKHYYGYTSIHASISAEMHPSFLYEKSIFAYTFIGTFLLCSTRLTQVLWYIHRAFFFFGVTQVLWVHEHLPFKSITANKTP